jgi:hypothetical protein
MFGDVLFSTTTVLSQAGTDLSSQFVPWREFGFGEMARANLPLWNPFIFAGAPYLGGFQSAMFYPPNLLHLIAPVATVVNVLVALHIFLLGALTYWWAAQRGLHPLAATVAGALAMFNGAVFLHVYAGHLPNLLTLAWMPLVLLAADRLFEAVELQWVLVGTVAVAMQVLAGHPQYAFYTGFVLVLYAGLHLPSVPAKGRVLGALLLMYGGAALLSGVQLLAGLAAAEESIRSQAVPFEFAAMFSFPPENLATLLVPGFFGDMNTVPYWGRWYLWEMSLFVGATGLLLALYGAIAGRHPLRGFAVAMIGLCFLLALGDNTPLFRALYEYVPGFNSFRGSSKFAAPMMLFVALLAGIGVDSLIESRARVRGLSRGAIIGGALLVIAGLSVNLGSEPPQWLRGMIAAVRDSGQSYVAADTYASAEFLSRAAAMTGHGLLVAGISLMAAGACLFARLHRTSAVYAIAVLAILEVFVFARSARPTFVLSDTRDAEAGRVIAERAHGDRVLNLADPNAGMSFGLRDAWGYDPGVPLRYAEFMTFTQGGSPGEATQYVSFTRPNPLYQMLRLRFVVSPSPDGPRLTEQSSPMPRTMLLYEHKVMRDRDEIFRELASDGFDPRRTVLLESPVNAVLRRPLVDESPTVTVRDESTDQFSVEANLGSPAILLITDGYSRHWRATANPGSAQTAYEVVPANYVLMAVPLLAGRHSFTVEYAPVAYEAGRWVSLLALCGLAAAGTWCFRRNRRSRAIVRA